MARSPLQKHASGAGRPTTRWRYGSTTSSWLATAALLCLSSAPAAHAQRSCAEWSAELTAVEGTVEIRRNGDSAWTNVASGERICPGDTLRVQASSRAMLTLVDQSTLRLGEHTTLGFPEPESGGGSLLDLLRGVIHVISRDPRSLRFTTPYANAGLEGTEFDIRVDALQEHTEVAVLEGDVIVTTPAGELDVASHHLARARAGQPPTSEPLPAPIELMRWAAHYPAIIDRPLPEPDQAPSPQQAVDADFFAHRAASHLVTAQLDAANSDLETALRLAPGHATARALQALLALARGDRETAQRLATAASGAQPPAVPALIASSYVQQSATDLDAAEHSIRQALAVEPDNALAIARLAELELARGNTAASIEHANRAAALAPTRSNPLTILGFAHLSRLDPQAARAAFAQAIALEPAAPLPRLGLALTSIQSGELLEGRRQLEIAVVLDPTNALTRSYMAKVYEAEHRAELTTSQLDLAKDFAPLDPTPWLYAALQKLRSNRPVEALQDWQAATAKNGDQAVFRSSLTLDEDLATRSAGLGRLHSELGFGRLALLDAWRAVADEPADYASHRLLADVYSTAPQHEIARVSELLVSQLLQPINLTPIKPQLAQPAIFIAQRSGPSQASFNELGPVVTTNGPQLQASSVLGGNGSNGADLAVAGLHDRFSYSVGQYRFATDGFRDNNDLDQRIGNAFVQFRPDPDTSLQAELRASRTEHGDLALLFDPQLYDSLFRVNEQVDSIRLGASRRITERDNLLASVIYQDAGGSLTRGDAIAIDQQQEGYSVDLQHLRAGQRFRLQTGLTVAEQDETSVTRLAFPGLPDALVTTAAAERRQTGLYSYAHFRALPSVTVTMGGAFDQLSDQLIEEDAFSPKLGVFWRPSARTTVRAAAFRALFGSLTASREHPQPRLEPAQVAGFSQLLLGGTADEVTLQGLGIDHAVSERVFLGLEALHRDTDRSVLAPFNPPESAVTHVNLAEKTQQAYVYWTPHDRVSINARYEHGRYASEPIELIGYSHMTIERLPIEVRYFAPIGLTAGVRGSYVHQTGQFWAPPLNPGEPFQLAPGEDRFWVFDAFIGYRLPNRRGFLSLNADNLLDERFRFQDIDPEKPTVIPERLVSFRFTVAFD